MKEKGTPGEVLLAFLLLGLTSFGGPVAHLGYFRKTFVDKRKWLSEADYGAIVSLCQFLPGPASSQTGFCIGLARAGWWGGLAAWTGFTLPSALLMFAAAHWLARFDAIAQAAAVLHGLQLAAIAVVAQAVVAMTRSLCPDLPRRMLAVLAAAILILVPDTAGQILVLVISGFIGGFLPPHEPHNLPLGEVRFAPGYGALACIALFLVLLGLSSTSFVLGGNFALFSAFFRTGALVFGGGHVVLPLLQNAVVLPGWVTPKLFLAGYGVAQAMPGPLFTVAAFLGAVSGEGPGGAAGAAIAMAAIFLPGLLLVAGLLPYWNDLRRNAALAGTIAGVNAAVVGLLAFALLNLVAIGSVRSLTDVAITVLAFLALSIHRMPPIVVVAFCAGAGVVV